MLEIGSVNVYSNVELACFHWSIQCCP